jgi:hypothetical protein
LDDINTIEILQRTIPCAGDVNVLHFNTKNHEWERNKIRSNGMR